MKSNFMLKSSITFGTISLLLIGFNLFCNGGFNLFCNGVLNALALNFGIVGLILALVEPKEQINPDFILYQTAIIVCSIGTILNSIMVVVNCFI